MSDPSAKVHQIFVSEVGAKLKSVDRLASTGETAHPLARSKGANTLLAVPKDDQQEAKKRQQKGGRDAQKGEAEEEDYHEEDYPLRLRSSAIDAANDTGLRRITPFEARSAAF